MYKTIGTYFSLYMTFCCPRTTDSHPERTISINCCIHTVVPPDDGPRYARNMYRLTKYVENKLCIKLVVLDFKLSPCCECCMFSSG
jgi:hypothetical protein